MAISELMPGVDVCIKVDGQALREYEDNDTEDEDRTVMRYIEAVSGQVFELQIEVKQNFKFFGDVLSFDVHVDGSEKLDGPPGKERQMRRRRLYKDQSRL